MIPQLAALLALVALPIDVPPPGAQGDAPPAGEEGQGGDTDEPAPVPDGPGAGMEGQSAEADGPGADEAPQGGARRDTGRAEPPKDGVELPRRAGDLRDRERDGERPDLVLPPRPAAGSMEPEVAPDGARSPGGAAKEGDLALPPRGASPPSVPPPTPASGAPPPAAPGGAVPPGVAPGGGVLAARALLDRLRAVSDPAAPEVADLGRELALLGEDGRSAARAALLGPHAPACVAGARALLAGGAPADFELVVGRLKGPLPAGAAEPLLAALLLDPVLATPELLVSLLDHPEPAMRRAVRRELEARVGPEHLPYLATRLRSDDPSTRETALELVALVSDPAATNLLFDRLGDGRASVARRAATLLARREEPGLAERLVDLAIGGELASRASIYALLAIVEREDRHGAVLLGDAHAPTLLHAMRVGDPFTAGAAAVALAGIGFRSADPVATAWLDREVPHELVRQVSGASFHTDFSSLQEPARRRLQLVSGQTFGTDGPAWRAWWVAAAPSFRAHRAVLAFAPEDVPTLSVACRTGPSAEESLLLLGPAAPPPTAAELATARVVHLTHAECADLVAVLRREGVLGGERLPGARAGATTGARELTVRIGSGSKSFRLPAASAADGSDRWFEAVAEAVRALDEANRWQRFPVAGRHASTRELWEEQHARWAEPRSGAERARDLKALVLDHLDGLRSVDRDEGLAELERLYDAGAAEPGDFPRLLALLRDEVVAGKRLERLVGLLVRAGRAAGGGAGLPAELGRDVVLHLAERFGAEARGEVVRVLEASGPELAREAAGHELAAVRALAAAALGRDHDPESRAELLGLLADPDPAVEAAAVAALGAAPAVEAREEVLLRARVGSPEVRAAALRALGNLCESGDEDARDALVRALPDRDLEVQVAAVEGLAALADPATASLLVSLFARGPDSPVFEPARAGLRRLGDAATEDLLRLASAGALDARREAALLLAENGVAAAAPLLIAHLSLQPDPRVAQELAVLTGVDPRGAEDVAGAWWAWWDGVVHDDSLAWFRAACERVGLAAPPGEAFRDGGTRAAARFALEVTARPEAHLAERARRELERMLGRELPPLPAAGPAREAWRNEVRNTIELRSSGR